MRFGATAVFFDRINRMAFEHVQPVPRGGAGGQPCDEDGLAAPDRGAGAEGRAVGAAEAYFHIARETF